VFIVYIFHFFILTLMFSPKDIKVKIEKSKKWFNLLNYFFHFFILTLMFSPKDIKVKIKKSKKWFNLLNYFL